MPRRDDEAPLLRSSDTGGARRQSAAAASSSPSGDDTEATRLSMGNDREMTAVSAAAAAVPEPSSSSSRQQIQSDDFDSNDVLVDVPDDDSDRLFSWRKLWAFTGPGFLMSIAYLDPGNIEADLRTGAIGHYRLLWVLLAAHIAGLLLQRMSARLGVVAGKHMAEVAYTFYPKVPRVLLWLMIEVAIVGSDMQEVVGTAIALFLLSAGRIPLYVGVIITILDTLSFLFIDRYGVRKLEAVFAVLISVMAISFGYEFVVAEPDLKSIARGFIPGCEGCGSAELLQAVALSGSILMPHNLYLHSALVKSRRVDRTREGKVREANFYYFLESGLALLCSFFVNLLVVSVFAEGFYQKTNWQIRSECDARGGIPDSGMFPKNNETAESSIYKGGIFLGCQYGLPALYIWAIGILASGQSSTMTGTYAGQFVMEGFVQLRWVRWKRVLLTRSIAIAPTLAVAFLAKGVTSLTGMNDLLNCIQMVQLPFALIPIITFTSSRHIMHNFRSSRTFQTFAIIAAFCILGVNAYFIFDYITEQLGTDWWVFLVLAGPALAYFTFVAYLLLCCFVAMDVVSEETSLFGLTFKKPSDSYEITAPWLADPTQSGGSVQQQPVTTSQYGTARTSD